MCCPRRTDKTVIFCWEFLFLFEAILNSIRRFWTTPHQWWNDPPISKATLGPPDFLFHKFNPPWMLIPSWHEAHFIKTISSWMLLCSIMQLYNSERIDTECRFAPNSSNIYYMYSSSMVGGWSGVAISPNHWSKKKNTHLDDFGVHGCPW